MLNNVAIMGRLCADPELRKTAAGTSVTNARIAVERNYADQNGERETDFFDIIAWGGTADFLCTYFDKGRRIALNGRLQTRSWVDKNETKRVNVEIVAESIYFADSKPVESTPAESSYLPEKAEPAQAKGRRRKAA